MTKIPLRQQLEALETEIASRRSRRPSSLEAYQTRRLEAALATLTWLRDNETEIRAAVAARHHAAAAAPTEKDSANG